MSSPNPIDPIEPGTPGVTDPDPHHPEPGRNPDMPDKLPEEVPPPKEDPDGGRGGDAPIQPH